MCSARTTVLVLAGPGERPEGCRGSAEGHAARLGLDLRWRDVEAAGELADLLRLEGARHDVVVLASGEHASSQVLADAVREIAGGDDAPPKVIHVDTGALDHLDVVHHVSDRVIHGRHRRVFHDALAALRAERDRPPLRIAYGGEPAQVADLRLPDGSSTIEGAPVAVLFHGGFWLDPYERDLMSPLAVALSDAGWATWNVEYRRRGRSGGGWPTTVEDACAAVDALADVAEEQPIDPGRIVLIGHSAGAQLAVYAAARRHLPADAPGRIPRHGPAGIVGLAGLLDLEDAEAQDLGGGAVAGLLGSSDEHPDRYRLASPVNHLPLGLPQLAIHGADDTFVPATQTRRYVEVARSVGERVTVAYPDVHHLDIISPVGPTREPLLAWLAHIHPGR